MGPRTREASSLSAKNWKFLTPPYSLGQYPRDRSSARGSVGTASSAASSAAAAAAASGSSVLGRFAAGSSVAAASAAPAATAGTVPTSFRTLGRVWCCISAPPPQTFMSFGRHVALPPTPSASRRSALVQVVRVSEEMSGRPSPPDFGPAPGRHAFYRPRIDLQYSDNAPWSDLEPLPHTGGQLWPKCGHMSAELWPACKSVAEIGHRCATTHPVFEQLRDVCLKAGGSWSNHRATIEHFFAAPLRSAVFFCVNHIDTNQPI